MWEEFILEIFETTGEVLDIIYDALCFGFEFKVENHKLYFREITNLPKKFYKSWNFFLTDY